MRGRLRRPGTVRGTQSEAPGDGRELSAGSLTQHAYASPATSIPGEPQVFGDSSEFRGHRLADIGILPPGAVQQDAHGPIIVQASLSGVSYLVVQRVGKRTAREDDEEEEEEEEKPAAKRPQRNRRAANPLEALPILFSRPPYQPETSHARAGGKHSSALLGPNSNAYEKSDADSKKPGAIIAARQRHNHTFKAGHLLNAIFGGDGKDPKNLTILTSSANGAMRGFDENIKRAVEDLRRLYLSFHDSGIDIKPVRYGIKVDIRVSDDKWGADYPDNCIANWVFCTAAKQGATPRPLTPDEQVIDQRIDGYILAANNAGTIDNRQSTLPA